jgi:serine/threonine protein kinase
VPECLSDNAIADLIDGRLDGDRQQRARAHLDSCDSCRRLVADVARTSTLRQAQPAEGPLAAGARVGRYQIVGVLGSGGMGVVYDARDPELDRTIALKLLHACADATELQVRLLREAQAMARLSHPNVLPVFDVGTWEGRVFVAMEKMPGGTLAGWLRERPRTRDQILSVFRRAGRGLQAAHDAGLLHRDFKPDNVLVDGETVRVSDFGLARRSDEAAPAPSGGEGPLDVTLTRTGSLVGTPAYMAPEQLDGRMLDVRADVFSFSVALWEALFGARPFAGSTVGELRAAIAAGPKAPPRTKRRAFLDGCGVLSHPAWPKILPRARPACAGSATPSTAALAFSAACWRLPSRSRWPARQWRWRGAIPASPRASSTECGTRRGVRAWRRASPLPERPRPPRCSARRRRRSTPMAAPGWPCATRPAAPTSRARWRRRGCAVFRRASTRRARSSTSSSTPIPTWWTTPPTPPIR